MKSIGIEGARWIEENVDEQFKAIASLRDLPPSTLLGLVILHALSSYQLSMRGEAWWWTLAKWAREEGPDNPCQYMDFLYSVPVRLREQKLRRIKRLCPHVGALATPLYYSDMEKLWKNIAQLLGSPTGAKTVVFAIKMFGYGARLYLPFRPYPPSIPIPLDSRIRAYTSAFSDDPASFWACIAELSNIPPLHIDSILWPLLGNPGVARLYRERFNVDPHPILSV